ncbi:MAG: DUF411 domain-containing protein [bacterium]|nr:DUF411 domain-containing protein [bacterium]
MKNANIFWIVLSLLILGGVAGMVFRNDSPALSSGEGVEVVVYRDASCGCCKVYADYLERLGFLVRQEIEPNMGAVKQEYGIPNELASCHTTIIGDYVVEGHIPVQAIEKLLAEKPDIKGIAMPGMPQGSPGMPGAKIGVWKIHTLERDGSSNVFLEL